MPTGGKYLGDKGFFAQLCYTKITSLIMHLYDSTFINAKLLRSQAARGKTGCEKAGLKESANFPPHARAGQKGGVTIFVGANMVTFLYKGSRGLRRDSFIRIFGKQIQK